VQKRVSFVCFLFKEEEEEEKGGCMKGKEKCKRAFTNIFSQNLYKKLQDSSWRLKRE